MTLDLTDVTARWTATGARRRSHGRGRRTTARVIVVLTLLLLTGPASAEHEVPFLSGRVNDLAGMIPAEARTRIEQKLVDLEGRTGAQVVILTIDGLEGDSLERYSMRVAEAWKLGRRGIDDGVLLLIAKQDRKMRIETGYGLEGKLTDAVSRQILDDVIRPRFRQGDFGAGIETGVDALIATVEGAPIPRSALAKPQASRMPILPLLFFIGLFGVVIGVFSLVALLAPGGMGWFLYLFLLPFYFAFPTAMFPPYGGLIAGGAWMVGFPALRLWLRSAAGQAWVKRHPRVREAFSNRGSSGSGGGWRSGGGGSGGGFSGGGGSFGGGGSSSSW